MSYFKESKQHQVVFSEKHSIGEFCDVIKKNKKSEYRADYNDFKPLQIFSIIFTTILLKTKKKLRPLAEP